MENYLTPCFVCPQLADFLWRWMTPFELPCEEDFLFFWNHEVGGVPPFYIPNDKFMEARDLDKPSDDPLVLLLRRPGVITDVAVCIRNGEILPKVLLAQ